MMGTSGVYTPNPVQDTAFDVETLKADYRRSMALSAEREAAGEKSDARQYELLATMLISHIAPDFWVICDGC